MPCRTRPGEISNPTGWLLPESHVYDSVIRPIVPLLPLIANLLLATFMIWRATSWSLHYITSSQGSQHKMFATLLHPLRANVPQFALRNTNRESTDFSSALRTASASTIMPIHFGTNTSNLRSVWNLRTRSSKFLVASFTFPYTRTRGTSKDIARWQQIVR